MTSFLQWDKVYKANNKFLLQSIICQVLLTAPINLDVKKVCDIFKRIIILEYVLDAFKLKLGVYKYKHQTNLLPQTFFQIILSQISKPVSILQEMPKVTVFIKVPPQKKMFSDWSIWITGPTSWNSLDTKIKHCKTTFKYKTKIGWNLCITKLFTNLQL